MTFFVLVKNWKPLHFQQEGGLDESYLRDLHEGLLDSRTLSLDTFNS